MTASRINAIAFAELICALADGGSFEEIAEHSGWSLRVVYGYVNALHKRGQVHIESWAPDRAGRMCVKVFKLGPGKDARKKRVSPTESCRRWRQKLAARATFDALTQLGA